MELWLTFAALLAWQGLVRVPRGGMAFLRFFGSVWILRRPGLTWLPPLGIDPSFALPGLGLLVTPDLAYVEDPADAREHVLTLSRDLAFATQGSWLSVESPGQEGKTWLRASSAEHARLLGERLKQLALAPANDRVHVSREIERRAFDPSRARTELRRVESSVRLLGILTTAEVAGLAVVPLFLSGLGSEGGLRMVLPVLGVIHGLAWLALLWAERRLGLPGKAERLAVAALYPPALLYAPSTLHGHALQAFHPLAVAPALARERELLASLQRAAAEAALPSFERHGGHDVSDPEARRARCRRQGELLRSLAGACGIDPERLSAAPERVGPVEDRWCPICRDAFRAGFGSCPDCGVATRRFAGG